MCPIEIPILEKTVQRTQGWLQDLSRLMGWSEEEQGQSYFALKAVLQALRDGLPVTSAIQLGAQLPLLIRGIYYDGWIPSQTPVKIDQLDDFFSQVAHYLREEELIPYTRIITKSVFFLLGERVVEGEIEFVKQVLPRPVASFWPNG